MYKFIGTPFYIVALLSVFTVVNAFSTEEEDHCKSASNQERCEKGKEYWTYSCIEDECKNVTLNACGEKVQRARFSSQEECEEKCSDKSKLCISSSSAEKEKRQQAETRQPHHQHQHNHHHNHHKKKQTSGSPKGKSKHQSYTHKKKKGNRKLALKFGRRRPLKLSGRMAKRKS